MNIPTAEETLKNWQNKYQTSKPRINESLIGVMKEFAKLHVEAAKEEIAKKAKTKDEWSGNTGSEYCDTIVDKDSILNSYSLTNIK